MKMIELLQEKIRKNKERLESMKVKRDNLERSIQNLETKIANQEFTLQHTSPELVVEKSEQTKESNEEQLSIADQILG